MTAAQQPEETFSPVSLESQVLEIYDRLLDHGHCSADVVLAPADGDGGPDWENTGPANVSSLPHDLWPDDLTEAKRACVIVSNIDGCDPDSTFIVTLHHETGIPGMFQIHGPEIDRVVADSIIGRDLGNRPPPKEPTELQKSMVKLREELFAPQPAAHVATNDNAQHDERLVPYLAAFAGSDAFISGNTVFGAVVGGLSGKIQIVADGRALFTSRLSKKFIELPVRPKSLAATPFSLGDPTALPLRDWLYGKHYIRKYVTASVGRGGGGKTAHSISEALAMVTGRPLLETDGPLAKPLRIWWINAEDPQDEIDRRFHAAAKHFGVTNDHIGGRLFTDSGRDQQFVIARQEGRDLKIVEPFISDMVAEIRRREIDAVIIDPFVSTHEAQENDNGAMQRVAAAWTRVADEANCGVELVHHVAKNQGEVTADSARGGGAFKDKVRSMRVFNVMTKEEAERAGVENPRAFFRLDLGKTNMQASGNSQWRRFVSVPLMNGSGLIKNGDEIGVVESWRWPASADAVSNVTPEQLHAIKRKIDGGDCRDNIQSSQWAGFKVAEALRMNMAIPAEKKEVRRMLDDWKQQGHFTIEQRPDYKGIERPCLVPVFHTSDL
ncbi:AAA family ATPase [Rhizobium ruizarguesonis]